MSNLWGEDASLEAKLMRMPFQKMMGLIEDLEGLDRYLVFALNKEKPDGWQEKIREVETRKKKRVEFISARIALDAGHSLQTAYEFGKLRGSDFDSNLGRILPAPPKRNPGLELCALAWADIFLNSQMECRRYSQRFFQEGRLRALVEMYQKKMHGKFLVLYPDGNIWLRGFYRDDAVVSESMQFYLPDGKLAESAPIPNNVIPFKTKSVSEPE